MKGSGVEGVMVRDGSIHMSAHMCVSVHMRVYDPSSITRPDSQRCTA